MQEHERAEQLHVGELGVEGNVQGFMERHKNALLASSRRLGKWVQSPDCSTNLVHLPLFRKRKLKHKSEAYCLWVAEETWVLALQGTELLHLLPWSY